MISRKAIRCTRLWALRARIFLKAELSSFPGRRSAALRLTLACVTSLVLVVLFRLPGATLGAFFPFLLARDGLRSTFRSVLLMSAMAILATADTIGGVMLFAGAPSIHFLWISLNLLLVFFLISTCRSAETVVGFGLMITATITVWDQHTAAETRIQITLFILLSVLIACVTTLAVEIVFQEFRPTYFLRRNIHARLVTAADYLHTSGNDRDIDDIRHSIRRLSHRGTSGDWRHVRGRALQPEYSALVSLSGRLIDLLAVWSPSVEDRLASRAYLLEFSTLLQSLLREHDHVPLPRRDKVFQDPLLHEIRETVCALISLGQSDLPNEKGFMVLPEQPEELFAPDSFSNPKHIRFAMRGAISALVCYCVYMSVGWTGLNSALTTCILTAIPTTAGTRHRQLLRFAGMFAGAGICGIFAEALFLSQIDSLLSFAAIFGVLTFLAAWLGTSTPRLAFAGPQMALAFDIVVLNRFSVNPDLSAARDCIFGILLGLVSMWFIFERLWPSDARMTLPNFLSQTMKRYGHFTRSWLETNPDGSVEAIQAAENMFRTVDRMEFLAEVLLFERELRKKRGLGFSAMKKFVAPMRKMIALSPVPYPGRGFSWLPSRKLREISENTLLACADLIEGEISQSASHAASLTELETQFLNNNMNQEFHSGVERQAALSYLSSLRQLTKLSESYYLAYYKKN
jgi:multidrug resistance protein MdtO